MTAVITFLALYINKGYQSATFALPFCLGILVLNLLYLYNWYQSPETGGYSTNGSKTDRRES